MGLDEALNHAAEPVATLIELVRLVKDRARDSIGLAQRPPGDLSFLTARHCGG